MIISKRKGKTGESPRRKAKGLREPSSYDSRLPNETAAPYLANAYFEQPETVAFLVEKQKEQALYGAGGFKGGARFESALPAAQTRR
jgi:hypothetical protein